MIGILSLWFGGQRRGRAIGHGTMRSMTIDSEASSVSRHIVRRPAAGEGETLHLLDRV